MPTHPVLIAGRWRAANATSTFTSENPATGEVIPGDYPVSAWADIDEALTAATAAAETLRTLPREQIAKFLTRFAERLEARATELVETAHRESGLAVKPRLADVELPRTTGQLRQAAAAVVEGSWALPTIDTKANIRSVLAGIGPVWVFGPNNFPFAFNSAAGGDFAAAIAAGNPVIAKSNTSHPGSTRILAEEAFAAVGETGLPPATVQLIYRTGHADGERLVADHRTGATGYTGARNAGLKLKRSADAAGKPIYLELSAVNPVVILPGALAERGAKLVDEFVGSALMGCGQFCTNPGLTILIAGAAAEEFIGAVKARYEAAPVGALLSSSVQKSLGAGVATWREAGAQVIAGGAPAQAAGYRFANTLVRVDGEKFLAEPEKLQAEAFGNASLILTVKDEAQLLAVLNKLEGNLTGCVYSDTKGADDALYTQIEPVLRQKVGRLLNDKMPTGVAVSAAMNHGGPFPSTGHPGFTAVGIPASLRRFAALHCYDAVRAARLPAVLRDANPTGKTWRLIDGQWTQGNVGA